MSRPLRIQYPGAVYHVMNRGNGRERIFNHSKHYKLFLECLSEAVEMWELKLHAYSLLPNHYHLLLETPLGNLSRAMRHLNHVYTQRFNRLTRRDGHLFRGRYKAILVEEDAYLVELARYIHLNSVKAKVVSAPERHEWTSHRHYLAGDQEGFLTTGWILSYFGKRKSRARRKLHEFVMEGVPGHLEICLDGKRWPSVFSREHFEDWVKWNFVKDLKDKELKYVGSQTPQISEKRLQKVLCEEFRMKWNQIQRPRGLLEKQRRAIAIWFYRRYLKKPYPELERCFGVGQPRISKIMKSKDLISPELRERVHILVQ